MKLFIEMFPMNFKSLMGSIKSRCDILNGTTQGWVFPRVDIQGYRGKFKANNR